MIQEASEVITALAAIGAVLVSYLNNRKLQSVHVDLNSRLSELLAASAHAARADGIAQGRKDANNEAGR
jgi:hypothetical protein